MNRERVGRRDLRSTHKLNPSLRQSFNLHVQERVGSGHGSDSLLDRSPVDGQEYLGTGWRGGWEI